MKSIKKVKVWLSLAFLFHLVSFLPLTIFPSPIIVLEPIFIEGLLILDMSDIMWWTCLIFIAGQILGIRAIIIKETKRVISLGIISTICLIIGKILWYVDAIVLMDGFCIFTDIPFIICTLVFWYVGIITIIKTTANNVYSS